MPRLVELEAEASALGAGGNGADFSGVWAGAVVGGPSWPGRRFHPRSRCSRMLRSSRTRCTRHSRTGIQPVRLADGDTTCGTSVCTAARSSSVRSTACSSRTAFRSTACSSHTAFRSTAFRSTACSSRTAFRSTACSSSVRSKARSSYAACSGACSTTSRSSRVSRQTLLAAAARLFAAGRAACLAARLLAAGRRMSCSTASRSSRRTFRSSKALRRSPCTRTNPSCPRTGREPESAGSSICHSMGHSRSASRSKRVGSTSSHRAGRGHMPYIRCSSHSRHSRQALTCDPEVQNRTPGCTRPRSPGGARNSVLLLIEQ